jgi:iron complex transport system permease protein
VVSKINFKSQTKFIVVLLFFLLLTSFVISFMLGRYPINPKELILVLFSKVLPIKKVWDSQVETIVFNVRMPRILMACLIGAALSAAGAAYQGIFQNPMVSPDVLGASAGAGFGAATGIFFSFGYFRISLTAFCFSIGAVAIVYLISTRLKNNQTLGLVLSGMMISSLFSAGTSFLKLVADPNNQLPAITYWLMGSLASIRKSDVSFASIPILIGLIPLLLLRYKINVLTIGDDEAKTLGINTATLRLIIVICATLITAASVSVSGMIGWVGLIIPHFSRVLVGPNYKVLLPTSMLMGGIFLLIVDNIARLAATSEIPIGILTAFVGAPFFLYLILREGKKQCA